MNVTFIVPTIGRGTLKRTLASIEIRPGDEVLVIGDVPREPHSHPQISYLLIESGDDWGATERNVGMECANGDILSFMDDDDVYLPRARDLLEQASRDLPTIFRMRLVNGDVIWKQQALECGNVGTPMIVVPNDPVRLGRWSSRYICDYDFIMSCRWPTVQWNPNIIAQVRPQ